MKPFLFSAIVLTSVTSSLAQFVPGHVFITEGAAQGCSPPFFGQNDRIWEIDPDTGSASLFAKLPNDLCGGLTSAVFTPDGTRLRVASFWHDSILEFDSAGDFSVVLDFEDGVIGPGGFNGLAYDTVGNFYVANAAAWTIVRFPNDEGSGEIFADVNDGIANPDAILFTDDGSLFFVGGGGPWGSGSVVLQLDHAGRATVFDSDFGFVGFPQSIAADVNGNLYVGHNLGDLYRYRSNDPTSREVFVADTFFGHYPMVLTPDQSRLYVTNFTTLYTVEVQTGDVEVVAEFPGVVGARASGIAVAPARLGDVNRNGMIDLGDFAAFQVCFGGAAPKGFSDPCHEANMAKDGAIDIKDFAILQSALEGP